MLRAPPPPPPLPSGLGPTTQEPWDRGHGVVQVEFTKEGAETLGLQAVRNYFPNQSPTVYFSHQVSYFEMPGRYVAKNSIVGYILTET